MTPVSLFVWMARPPDSAEQHALKEHVAKWRPQFAHGGSGYELEAVQLEEGTVPAPSGNGHGPSTSPGASGGERGFMDRMRQANVRTLVELGMTLRDQGARPCPRDIEEELRQGQLRYVARLQPGPSFARDVLTFVAAARELGALLPDADVRLHDGQLFRNARVQDVNDEDVRRALTGR